MSSAGDCVPEEGFRVFIRAPPPPEQLEEGGLRAGDVDFPQNSASTQRLKVCGSVLTSPRLFDRCSGGSIGVIECVLQKAEAQLLQN